MALVLEHFININDDVSPTMKFPPRNARYLMKDSVLDECGGLLQSTSPSNESRSTHQIQKQKSLAKHKLMLPPLDSLWVPVKRIRSMAGRPSSTHRCRQQQNSNQQWWCPCGRTERNRQNKSSNWMWARMLWAKICWDIIPLEFRSDLFCKLSNPHEDLHEKCQQQNRETQTECEQAIWE